MPLPAPTQGGSDAQQRVPRTLVLCFDGTSSEYDADNTNVVKFYALLKKDMDEQLCYYQAGIGTWFEPGVVSPLLEWGARMLDLAFAWYLDTHVINGYKFLMQNHRLGDKICIFGFSRGAYTARALGGFLYKVGLLSKDNFAQVPFAYRMYKRTDEAGLKLCAGFKETYCQTVEIEFMGVWETVSSVGVLAGRTLPFTNSNRSIKTFRHALSLDERRAKFRPNNYYRSPLAGPDSQLQTDERRSDPPAPGPSTLDAEDHELEEDQTSVTSTTLSEGVVQETGRTERDGRNGRGEKKERKRWMFLGRVGGASKAKEKPPRRLAPYITQPDLETDVQEVWFAGAHGDVGGGAVENEVPHSLSNISLRWMVREVMAAKCGVRFDIPALMKAKIDLDPEPSAEEIQLDLSDALEPLHDQLKLNWLWWGLEIIPLTYSWQDRDGKWHREFGFNFGRGRKIVDPHPKFHATVKRRMESPLDYRPRVRWEAGTEVYVH